MTAETNRPAAPSKSRRKHRMALLFTTAVFSLSTVVRAYAEDGPPTPQNHNTSVNAERDRLRKEFDNLGDRQHKLDDAREHYKDLLKKAVDDGDTKRAKEIRTILKETSELQTAIENQSTEVGLSLVKLEQPEMEAKADELNEIGQEINNRTAEEIAKQIKWDGDLQDVKQWITWVTRWVSIGSEMQYETDRGNRLGDYALAVANAKIKAVDDMLEDAEPGSYRHDVLTWKRDYYVSQRDAAQEYLDSMETLTQIGYGLDILLIATGAVAVDLGKKLAASAVSRAFGQQAAERTAVVLEKGLTEIGSDIVSRTAGRETADAGANAVANSAARGSGESALSSSSQAATDSLVMHGADEVLDLGLNITDEGFEAISNAFQEYLSHNNIPSPTRLGDASPEWVAAWKQFVNQHFKEVVGAAEDVIPNAAEMTSEQLAARVLEEEAALEGQRVFNSPAGQAIKDHWQNFWRELAQMKDDVAAYKKAQEVAGMRGVKALQQARKAAAEGWLDEALDGSTFFSAAPIFFGLLGLGASEAHAEESSEGSSGDNRQSSANNAAAGGSRLDALQYAIANKPQHQTGGGYSGYFGAMGGFGDGLAQEAQYEADRSLEEAGRCEPCDKQNNDAYGADSQALEIPSSNIDYGYQDSYTDQYDETPEQPAKDTPASRIADFREGANSGETSYITPRLRGFNLGVDYRPSGQDYDDGPSGSDGGKKRPQTELSIQHTPTGLFAQPQYEGEPGLGEGETRPRLDPSIPYVPTGLFVQPQYQGQSDQRDTTGYSDGYGSEGASYSVRNVELGAPTVMYGHENCTDPTHGHPVPGGSTAQEPHDLAIQHTPTGLYVQPQYQSQSVQQTDMAGQEQ